VQQSTNTPEPQTLVASINALNQPVVNSSLLVSSVSAAQNGWVVVHLDEDGKPGRVIGKSFVKQGMFRSIEFSLDESVKPGEKVWVMLHIDAGTLGIYEFPGPDAPVIESETIVMQQIEVLSDLPVPPLPSPTNTPLPTPTPTRTPIPVANFTVFPMFPSEGTLAASTHASSEE
jgi:hypothetical protein